MSEEKIEPENKHRKDEALSDIHEVDRSTEQETEDRERVRRKEEQKHHEQTGS